MPITINAFNHDEWNHHGLADFEDFTDRIIEVHVDEDQFNSSGDWYFVPDEPLSNGDRVIYFGSWGNDNSAGDKMYTNAEIFDALDPDHLIEFSKRVDYWESQPSIAEGDEDDVEHPLDEPWDHLLAQQELEDFEQADEYFGYCGDDF